MEAIIPPRLEDAGLEDCALPPESIMEAFYKAASAVKSKASSLFSGAEGGDPDSVCGPAFPGAVDGGLPADDLIVRGDDCWHGDCIVVKGKALDDEGKDKLVVVGEDNGEFDNEGIKGTPVEKESGDDEPTLTGGYMA